MSERVGDQGLFGSCAAEHGMAGLGRIAHRVLGTARGGFGVWGGYSNLTLEVHAGAEAAERDEDAEHRDHGHVGHHLGEQAERVRDTGWS